MIFRFVSRHFRPAFYSFLFFSVILEVGCNEAFNPAGAGEKAKASVETAAFSKPMDSRPQKNEVVLQSIFQQEIPAGLDSFPLPPVAKQSAAAATGGTFLIETKNK